MRKAVLIFFLVIPIIAGSQETSGEFSRGSIPEILLRPIRSDSPIFPNDTVIGELGRGRASADAYNFARLTANRIVNGNLSRYGLQHHESVFNLVSPFTFRIGSGREEPDGAVSFLIRFVGRTYGVTGELYIRYVTRHFEETIDEETITRSSSEWIFEDLLLENARTRDEEKSEFQHLYDFSPYQRFF